MNFHLTQDPEKTLTKFQGKLSKPLFLPILHPFSPFQGKKSIFLKNQAVSLLILQLSMILQQTRRKTMSGYQVKLQTDGWRERRKNSRSFN